MRSIYEEDSNPLEISEPASEENFLVSVRVRPLNRREIARHDVSDWECVNNTTIVSKIHDRGASPTAYSFDRVFGSDSSTRQVYEEGAKKVALSVINGINASIFAYGQTSSGKTFTMSRVTEYTIADIYNIVTKHESREFVLKFSAMEIYNECVRDLLTSDNTALRLLDDPERGTVVEKLTEVKLKDWEHLKGLLSSCQAQRQVGETSLNEVSSRSHQILRLTVESSARKFSASLNADMLSATVNFVDLAGSERASQTMSANTRLKEGCHINRSLLTLGSVIRKLSKGRNGHVQYRDSKLTRILQNSLGGNARTAIICTLSPAHSHFEQSRNTLLFASCAKQVTTSAQVNVVMSEKAMVKQLRTQLARLEKELKHLGSLSSNSSDSVSALQAKERLIEKMDKEIRELTQQRDHAHSRLHNLQHSRSSSWAESNFSDFDNEKGRVWEDDYAASEASDVGEPPRSENAITNASRRLSDRHEGVSNSKKNEESEGEEQLLSIEMSPTQIIDKYFGPDPSLGWEKMSHTSDDNIQETRQELQCVEVEVDRSGVKRRQSSSSQKSFDQELKANNNNDASEMDDLEIIDNTSDNEETSKIVAVDMNNNTIESTSYSSDVDMSSISRGIADISRDGRCEAIIIIMSSPDRNNSENVTQTGSEVETFAKVEVADKEAKTKISNEEDIDERDDCSTLFKSDYDSKCMEQFGGISKYSTSFVNEKGESLLDNENFVETLACQKQNVDNYVSEDENNESEMMVYDSQVASSNKFSEFEKKRREIIQLWNACNVQLIHRTYFFLLFKGEPADSIYLEVERRRLSYLRATLCKSAEAFYAKALLQEREKLRRQVLKKFTVKEMESIYEKWGIDVTSKQRRLQLCSRLWTDTKDMEHIKESAFLVAKLVGLEEPSHAPKEIFGLSLPPAPIRSHSWHGLPALL